MTNKFGTPAYSAEQLMQVARLADASVLPALFAESMGEKDLPTSHYPEWVRRGADKVNRALYPRIYEALEKQPLPRAYSLGIGFGMMVTGQKQGQAFEMRLPVTLPEPTKEQNDAVWRWLYGENSDTYTQLPDDDWIAPEIREELRQIEADLNPVEYAELHRGIFDATRMLMGKNAATETTKIYQLMVTFWRVIDLLPTGQSFIEFLTKALGQNIVGEDPKSILQMARRIGKTFGKPGRPKKTTSTRLKR